ncbi:MAG: hypothetical protein GVY36_03105 [Verrucomicrobia bacterium]|nr:hypothetical protein [Verrucomicrobiota bacterium]
MKTRAFVIVASLVLSIPCLGTAGNAYVNTYWEEYGNRPVEVNQATNGRTQALSFTAYENDRLVAELDGGVGEISLPVSDSMAQSLSLKDSSMSQIRRLIAGGDYDEALTLLRPLAYPLVKFHGIPESFTQMHAPIRNLLNVLIETERLSEAEDVLNRIELHKVDPEYSQLAIRLLNTYLGQENYEAAVRLTKKIPVQGDHRVNIRPIVDAADLLRAAGKFEAVIPLYQQLIDIVPKSAEENIRMWLAYSLVLAGRTEEATKMIEEIEEPASNKRTYSLYQLLIGSSEHGQEQYEAALDRLTRGYVRAQTSFGWVPEMLYLIGDCYERVNSAGPARSAWTELTILYPESPWARRAESSLASLPEPNSN